MIGTNMGGASRLRWPARARVRREAPARELGVVGRRVLPKPCEVRFLAWPIGNTIVQKNSFAL